MGRKEELLEIMKNNSNLTVILPLIDEVVFLEQEIGELQKLPFIRMYPGRPERQKSTPAAALYVKLAAQYNAAIRTLISASGTDNLADSESPLRRWAKKFGGSGQYADSKQNSLDTG